MRQNPRLLGPFVLLLAMLFAWPAAAQTAILTGAVLDPSGAAVPGAQIALSGAGRTLSTKSNSDGRYTFRAVAPGAYTITVTASGFSTLSLPQIDIAAGQTRELNLPLTIAAEREEVTVGAQTPTVGLNPDQNANATILRGSALNAFSDDPDELQTELEALAGPAAGPNGGEIYIDGFAGGKLPPKSSILEIRVNQNPFSAEFDRIGYGRVEIITKPGSQKFQGNFGSRGETSGFDTAVPLVSNQPSYYQYVIAGDVTGPLSKNASYDFNAYRIVKQNQAIVNALNPNGSGANIQQAYPTPITYLLVNPRLDFQLGARNIASIRDLYYRTNQQGSGVGALNLPSQASNVISEENELQVNDTFLVNPQLVNETHFQWRRIYNDQTPTSLAPTVTVEGTFGGGGSSGGMERDKQDNFELQNYSTATAGAHALRFGTRLRLYDASGYSTSSANGTYTFDTLAAYQTQQPSQYAATVIVNPRARATLFDGALFFQDDWHWKPNFMMSAGLRLEGQNRIHDHADWAPRLAIAWSPKLTAGAEAKTVIRAGYGWFYNRFTVPLTFTAESGRPYILQTIFENGINATGYVANCSPCTFNPNTVEPPSAVSATSIPYYYSLDPHFHAALDMQVGAGVDRQLAKGVMVNVTYLYTQGVHQYLTESVNAPVFNLTTYTPTTPAPPIYNYQLQSGGVYRQNQLILTASMQRKRFVLTGTYMLNNANSDTQGVSYVSAFAQNPGLDYGRANFGYRHRLTFINSYTGPWGIVFASVLYAQSGVPYNFTIGNDLTENEQFNARPTYGTCGGAGVVTTRYGCLDANPAGKGEPIIPFGLGTGPANVVYHLRLSKVVGVGPRIAATGEATTYDQSGGNVSGRGLSGGGAAINLDQSAPRRYNLTFVLNGANVFNIVNRGTPNGVLLSPLFGTTQSLAGSPFVEPAPGNRSVSLQATFAF